MAHSLETNVPFLIADCEATGTSVENMHVNDVILGGFINAYSCRIGLLEFFIVFKTKNNKKFLVCKCDSYTRMLRMNPP